MMNKINIVPTLMELVLYISIKGKVEPRSKG
jgi:hypothetical protein